MRSALHITLVTLLVGAGTGSPLHAQQWRDGSAIPLLERASAQRLIRDTDTLLAAWRATARGVVRMASIIDHGGTSLERVIRADELVVEVYGEAPNRHKQFIVAWRDTSFLPNRIRYHRDHLGIVANDFGTVLRLGEGEEVRDVVHPLSALGLTQYEFAVGDTLRVAGPTGSVRVVAIQVRPIPRDAPGTVGTLYIDLDRAVLVRFRFTFTASAYRDPTVEDITVTLENALQEGVRWLPWRQSIVIRRGSSWLDLPLRTVLRADWQIEDYDLAVVHPADRFLGFFVDGLRRPGGSGAWSRALADRVALLPDAEASIAEVQRDAIDALGANLLSGLPNTRLLAGGFSDLIRVNRVSGITPAVGLRTPLGAGITARLRGGVGLSDARVVGRVNVEGGMGEGRWWATAERQLADVGGTPVSSGLGNSLGALLDGEDLGDWTLVERLAVGAQIPTAAGVAALEVAREWSWSVGTQFSPIFGEAHPNPALGVGAATVARARLTHRDVHGEGWGLAVEVGAGNRQWQRVTGDGRTSFGMGAGRVELNASAGAGSSALPGYRHFVLGGRSTLPGVPYRSLGGQRMALVEIGWTLPVQVPIPRIPNARFIRVESAVTPFVAAGIAGGGVVGVPWRGTGRVEPVLGARLDLWGPLLRLEGGVALRTGRIGIGFDLHPDWWPLF